MLTGRCLCGAITYTVTGTPARPGVCHCTQCRRMSGHLWAAATIPDDQIAITGPVRWYSASNKAQRGFCSTCGSSLFYRLANQPDMMLIVSVDSLDDASGIELKRHIYVDEQPDRYAFADATPRVTKAELMKEFGIEPGND